MRAALLVLTPNANDPVPTDLATERIQPAYPPGRLAHERPSLHRFDALPQRLKSGYEPSVSDGQVYGEP